MYYIKSARQPTDRRYGFGTIVTTTVALEDVPEYQAQQSVPPKRVASAILRPSNRSVSWVVPKR